MAVVILYGLLVAWAATSVSHRYAVVRDGCGVVLPGQTITLPSGNPGSPLSPGRTVTIPSLTTPEDVCQTARHRASLGDAVTLIGVLVALAGVLGLLAAATATVQGRRRLLRREQGRPVARQSRLTGAVLESAGSPLVLLGVLVVGLGCLGVLVGASVSPLHATFTPAAVSSSAGHEITGLQPTIDGPYLLVYAGIVIGAVAMAMLGRAVDARARRHLAPSAAELLAEDSRPPVVYLRSFVADRRMSAATASSLADRLAPVTTAEEALVDALGDLGPVVALGVPGERLPPLGAARASTSDAEWKGQIADWVRHARLIVMLAGETQSFWWEIRHVRASDALPRTCILVPRDPDS